jgi:hypothetical protein
MNESADHNPLAPSLVNLTSLIVITRSSRGKAFYTHGLSAPLMMITCRPGPLPNEGLVAPNLLTHRPLWTVAYRGISGVTYASRLMR